MEYRALFSCMYAQSLSHVRLFVTPWTVACQPPLSTEFFRLEYWSGLPFLPSGDLPDPGINPSSPSSPALADGLFTTEPLQKPYFFGFWFCFFFRYTIQLIILFKVLLCFSQIKFPRLRTGLTLPCFHGGPSYSLNGSMATASTQMLLPLCPAEHHYDFGACNCLLRVGTSAFQCGG